MTQSILFDGLNCNTFAPSDIDGFIEVDNKYLILIEVKQKGKKMPLGQRLTLTRIVDAWNECEGKTGIIIKVGHTVTDCKEDIKLKDTIPEMVYHNKQWYKSTETLLETLDKFFKL